MPKPTLTHLLCIAFGGSLGAISRYLLGLWVVARLGSDFPWGTLLINVTGCLVMGFFGTLAAERAVPIPLELRLIIAVGFLGAYTTFSTYGFETVSLLQRGSVASALLYAAGSVLFGLLAVYVGFMLARTIA